MAAEQIFPLEVWTSQITQASVPANENALRVQVVNQGAIAIQNAQPGSPSEDDLYILGASPSGAQWATMTPDNAVIFKGGTWLEFEAFPGWLKVVGSTLYIYDSGWSAFTGSAPSFSPSVDITASATLALGDSGKFINGNHASTPIVVTVPTNATVAFPVDTEVHVRWRGVASVSIAAAVGVTINYPASQTLDLKERYAVATLKKMDTDTWALFGMLEDL